MPAEVPLTPRAARRVAREGALHSFDQAALALNEDWCTHLDGKQIQRWSEAIGRSLTVARDDVGGRMWEVGGRMGDAPSHPTSDIPHRW